MSRLRLLAKPQAAPGRQLAAGEPLDYGRRRRAAPRSGYPAPRFQGEPCHVANGLPPWQGGVDGANPCSAKGYDHQAGLVCHFARCNQHRVIGCQAVPTLPHPLGAADGITPPPNSRRTPPRRIFLFFARTFCLRWRLLFTMGRLFSFRGAFFCNCSVTSVEFARRSVGGLSLPPQCLNLLR